MSNSSLHKTLLASFVAVVFALAASGCDGNVNNQSTSSAAQAPTPAQSTAPTSATAADPTDENGSGGASAKPGTEAQIAPVDVTLAGSGFAASTPKTIHVPSGFLIVVTVKSESTKQLSLGVLAPSMAQTFKIAPKGQQKISVDALDAGKSAKLIVGDETVKVAADADPGP
jgi:hypothetical protein